MQITVNGESHQLAQPITVAQLLRSLELAQQRVAVEVNREIVPRSAHGSHTLSEGDRVEVVRAIGGG